MGRETNLSEHFDETSNIRISPRVRKTVYRPDVITDEEFMEAVLSQQEFMQVENYLDNDLPSDLLAGHSEEPELSTSFSLPASPDRLCVSISPDHTRNSLESTNHSHAHTHVESVSKPTPTPPKTPVVDVIEPKIATSIATKPNIKFIYHIILSRFPTYQERTWQPQGKFMDKTLSMLLEELPFQSTLKVVEFCLTGPGMEVNAQIDCKDEAAFDAMKKRWTKQIRACLLSHTNTDRPLLIEIEIGPTKAEDEENGDQDEVAALDW
jgi:hypothetical protein